VTIWLKNQLENVRDFVQHSLAEKARDNNRSNGPSYDGDDDISMYGDSVKPTYGLGEVKKRRGVSTHGPSFHHLIFLVELLKDLTACGTTGTMP